MSARTAAAMSLDDWWRQYAACYAGRTWLDYRSLLAEVVQHATATPVLDVACGFGFLVECARRFGIPAIGVEGAAAALDEARRRHPLADIRSWTAGAPLPLADGSVGVAVVHEVVDHLTADETDRLLTDVHRVLGNEGTLLVKSPSRANRFDTDEGHVNGFLPSEFRALVERHGFAVVSQTYLPQPLLGTSGPGWLLMRALSKVMQPERLNARIDLVAVKRESPRGRT
jgi:SAM-dependent methyltransferase